MWLDELAQRRLSLVLLVLPVEIRAFVRVFGRANFVGHRCFRSLSSVASCRANLTRSFSDQTGGWNLNPNPNLTPDPIASHRPRLRGSTRALSWAATPLFSCPQPASYGFLSGVWPTQRENTNNTKFDNYQCVVTQSRWAREASRGRRAACAP